MIRGGRLDPTGFQAAVAVAILAALANGVWIFLDHSNPYWDQAHFLTVTLEYRNGIATEGLGGFFHVLGTSDPAHGPLFTVAMLPFFYTFGSTARSGLLMNLMLAPVLYIAAGQIAWVVFRSWLARLLAILLVATMPLMVGLSHTTLQDFLLATLAAVSILLLLLSDRFYCRWTSLGLGVAMGLGTLTKVTFPGFAIGPLLIVLAQLAVPGLRTSEMNSESGALRRRLEHLLGAAAVYLLIVLPWYALNFSDTLDYVRSTTGGPLSEGAGPTHPLTFHAIATFTVGIVEENISSIIALAGLVAIILCLPSLRAFFRKPVLDDRVSGIAILLSWALIPYISIATAHNQDVRLMAPVMPAIAILIAGAIAAVPRKRARTALIGVTGVLLLYTTVAHTVSIRPSFLPGNPGLHNSSYEAAIPVDSRPIGYEQLPGDDYATPVMQYMEALVRAQDEPAVPQKVCMLESEPVINGNTVKFFAEARGDEFEITDILVDSEGIPGLRRSLAECDFALYVKPPTPSGKTKYRRVEVANEDYAAHYMSPSMIAIFNGPSRVFPLAPSRSVEEGEADYLSTVNRGDWVRVLSRR